MSQLPRIIFYLGAAALIALFPFISPNEFYLRLAQDIAIWAIAAIGLNLLLGYSGQLSLGQSAFFALGAYGSAIVATTYHWPLWLSIPLGVLVASAAGVVIGLVALRARTHYLAMATLAFGFIIEILCQRWVGLTGGSMGLIGVPQLNFGDFANGPIYFFWIAAGTLLLVQMLMDYVASSEVGRDLQALKESESFALTTGMNVRLWRAGVVVVSALLAGLAGTLFVHQSGYVSSDAFNLDRSINLLIAVVIGGLGRSYGALLGTAIVILLNQLTAGLYEVSYFIFGGILLVVMLFFPAGAVGAVDRVRRMVWGNKSATPAVSDSSRHALPKQIAMRVAPKNSPVLELDRVTKSYAGVIAVKDVSFCVRGGTIHALIGPNGAGKSTLINVISGLYRGDAGSISYLGKDVTGQSADQRANLGIARTFQNLQLIGTLTIVENVMLGIPRSHRFLSGFAEWLFTDREMARIRTEAMQFLEFFGIARLAHALPGDLAYGHRKLCELARALAQRPTLMLLDEPIAGLNEEEVREVTAAIRTLRDLGVTVLLVEHNMTFVMGLSETVTVLDYGQKIAEGPPAVVQRNQAVITAYLGTEVA
ncbi:MAG: branched-chain amino acid transport system ATP-binding protein livM [Thermoanaerobaculia bacterium]|jgi:ABC-type branched-subunit amino acid transport system ATPase component/ABC-type branched-subunit amino acid transport system permease subunit|nr:branched-chain amino acid transport system ATP-binding protein livM [Thermoanaerobaculia bacterium]